ncbi:hypothetical protein GQ457_01G017900 [Hibiscus cannabinus]
MLHDRVVSLGDISLFCAWCSSGLDEANHILCECPLAWDFWNHFLDVGEFIVCGPDCCLTSFVKFCLREARTSTLWGCVAGCRGFHIGIFLENPKDFLF